MGMSLSPRCKYLRNLTFTYGNVDFFFRYDPRFTVGMPITGNPRTDPSEPDSGTRLPSWVSATHTWDPPYPLVLIWVGLVPPGQCY